MGRGKSQPARGQISSDAHSNALLLKTDSTAAEGFSEANKSSQNQTAHKRLASHGYTSSQGTSAENAQQFLSQSTTQGTKRQGVNHTLGNTLGKGQQSLNMSNYGGYYSQVARDSSLNEQHPTTLAKAMNLSCLLK